MAHHVSPLPTQSLLIREEREELLLPPSLPSLPPSLLSEAWYSTLVTSLTLLASFPA